MLLTKEQVIQRLCKLVGDVTDKIGWEHCSQCICGDNPMSDGRQDGAALNYIERVVRQSLTPAQELALPGTVGMRCVPERIGSC